MLLPVSPRMDRLSTEKRARLIGLMVEGMSIRVISRTKGASRNTTIELLRDAGTVCSEDQDKALCNLACKRLQFDKIWSFVYAKEKNAPRMINSLPRPARPG